MSILKLTETQIKKIKSLDLSGKGGKENEIAWALDHKRNHQPLVDAECPTTGVLFEYKKQQGTQWFDLYKLSTLTKEQESIPILFFITDKEGTFLSLYQSTYQEVKDMIGLTPDEWEWAKNSPKRVQPKYDIKMKQIKTFNRLL
tara:strand:+ start:156 stop:587 length:432 start_codon:yes stop_codon:yes gene_type:complete